MSDLTYYVVYFWLLGVVGLVILIFLLRHSFRYRGKIQRSLNLELLAVRFPPISLQNELNIQQLRERVSLMEQFYAHLNVLKGKWWSNFLYGRPVFAMELTIPYEGEELLFYIAVPRRYVPSVEKIIQGIFSDAVVEKAKDYNIFNPEGEAAGSNVLLKEGIFSPVRTYQKLESDPMKPLTNVFTKLAPIGEGAVLQIIARPAKKKWRSRLKKRATLLYQGKKDSGFFFEVSDFLQTVFGSSREEKVQRPDEIKKLTPLQEDIVKALEGKANKALFETNVRLIASAKTKDKAEAILQGLELSFEQFTDPNVNSFRFEHTKRSGFKNLIFNFSFRSFDERKKIILGTEELTSIFHFPNIPTETPKMKTQKAKEAPPPAELPSEGLILGYSMFRGETRQVRIMEDDRRRHLYTIGQTGTGKSVFLENMIIQDIQAGKGVCVIDPHGELVSRMLEFVPRHRLQDVIYFNPGDIERPMGLNMLEYDINFPDQKTFIVNELFSIFQKLYGAVPEALGPMFEQYFRNATMLVMDDPTSGNTLLEISRVMSDKVFRDLKIARAKNIVVKNFWTQVAEKAGGEGELRNMVPYITSKFDVFIANEIMRPIIAQEKSSFNFREVMDSSKILLVNLSKGRLGDINSSLIGLIIVGKILMAALSRGNDQAMEKRRDFYLYIDEFQNVTTDSIATILSEARKYRLDLVITHQFIGQLKEEIKKAVFGNVGSMVSFRIGSDDAEFMAKQYKPIFAEQDLLNIDNHNCYVKLLIGGHTTQSFNMKTYSPQKGDPELSELAKEISRTKYGRSREEVENEIIQRHQVVAPAQNEKAPVF